MKKKKKITRKNEVGKKRKADPLKVFSTSPFLKKKSSKKFKIEPTTKPKEDENLDDDQEINELPYTRAIVLDKRNVFQIFKSIFLQKLEIISILIGKTI